MTQETSLSGDRAQEVIVVRRAALLVLIGAVIATSGLGLFLGVHALLERWPTTDGPPTIVADGNFVRALSPLPLRDSIPLGRLLRELSPDEAAYVVGDATFEGGSNWVRVQVPMQSEDGVFLWLNVGAGSSPAVVDAALAECPPEVTVGVVAALSPGERLECFGSRQILFSAAMFDRAPDSVSPYDGSPDWLAVAPATLLYGELGVVERMGFLEVHIPPDLGPVPVRQWVSVLGQFDHPSAVECQRTPRNPAFPVLIRAEPVRWCRERFVVTSYARSTPPTSSPAPRQPEPGAPR